MFYESPLWIQLMIGIGEATIVVALGLLFFSVILVMTAFYSIDHGQFYFPRVLKSGLVLMEGTVKAICKLCGLDDKELTQFFIRLHNAMNMTSFQAIPVDKRAIFLPQCLRSARCPAKLSPDGLLCQHCGQCEIGKSGEMLEKIGYRVFIVPGSTFLRRIVKKYRPEAIIGVGCMMEVKEGLEMTDRIGIVAMGVVTLKDGCVETIVNWQDVMDVAVLGVDASSVPEHLDISSH